MYYNSGMEFVELKKHLKTQKPHACYYCYGDDDFLIDRAVSLVGDLAAEPKPFNLSDKEFENAKALTDELMMLPIMSDHRVVIARGKIDKAAVAAYLKNPNPTTVLVLPDYMPHDSWNKSPIPNVPDGAVGVDCNRLAIKHVYPFVRAISSGTGSTIDDKTVELLYRRCGGYMTRINAETQKLSVMRAGSAITEHDVNAEIEPDTEFVVFELCDCILAGNSVRALEVVEGMAKNNDLVAAFTLIYNRFRKIFAAAVDPDGLTYLGVKSGMVTRLKNESAKFSKARLKNILDMLVKADYGYKTGAMTVYDALTGFVTRAAYAG